MELFKDSNQAGTPRYSPKSIPSLSDCSIASPRRDKFSCKFVIMNSTVEFYSVEFRAYFGPVEGPQHLASSSCKNISVEAFSPPIKLKPSPATPKGLKFVKGVRGVRVRTSFLENY